MTKSAATPSSAAARGSVVGGNHAALSSLEQSQRQLEEKLAALRKKMDL